MTDIPEIITQDSPAIVPGDFVGWLHLGSPITGTVLTLSHDHASAFIRTATGAHVSIAVDQLRRLINYAAPQIEEAPWPHTPT